jgi:hypothetical protein
MNTQQSTVNYFLESEWVEVIEEHIAAYPTAIALVIEPQLLGQYDAEQHLPCAPVERGYIELADAEMYCKAWHSTTKLMQETVDYKEYQLEIEWLRQGC